MNQIVPGRRLNLRDYTPARVSLPTTGNSIATAEVLNFQLAHAQARDAVHAVLDIAAFARRLEAELPILAAAGIPVLQLRSNASNRAVYLRHPHLGRTLDADSVAQLRASTCDLSIAVADGLSALAVERNAIPLLAELLPRLLDAGWTLGPLALVREGRVAIGDPVGLGVGARLSLVLIGERPGLSSADSLGAYLTWQPHPDRTDADRNCLSNIRDGGLSAVVAAERLFWYLEAARERRLTGTLLKEGEGLALGHPANPPMPR
jgi:ethanolamine ammonia-lyase small subunit